MLILKVRFYSTNIYVYHLYYKYPISLLYINKEEEEMLFRHRLNN